MKAIGHLHLRGVAVVTAALLAAVGCTRAGTGPGGAVPPTTARPGAGAGGTGGGSMGMKMPARLDHAPTEEQKKAALAFVDATRAAVKDRTVQSLQQYNTTHGQKDADGAIDHWINIGDGVHWVNPDRHHDAFELNPDHIEAFATKNNRIVAAMYVMHHGATIDDVPDIAGNWTMWHDHVLPYKSNDFASDDYYRLGGPYFRQTVPMIHVWLEPNPCGPFAGTDPGTGSCIKELANY